MSVQLDTLTVHEAAGRLGVTEKTIRRRIKAGTLAAQKVATAQGYEWRVQLDGQGVQLDGQGVHPHAPPAAPELLKALEMVSSLTQRNEQLAGQVGYLQARVQDQERQIALLQAPQDEPAPAEAEQLQRRRWWEGVKLWKR